jgi:hypothetical protein
VEGFTGRYKGFKERHDFTSLSSSGARDIQNDAWAYILARFCKPEYVRLSNITT